VKQSINDSVESRWSRVGALLHRAPAADTPDLERLLLDTARELGQNSRLFPLSVTWLVRYGNFVAKHRLKRLAGEELELAHRPALGLLLEAALERGAASDLAMAVEACGKAPSPGPLFAAQKGNAALGALAERHASALSRKWGVWAPEVTLKDDAVRPVSWILRENPTFRERIIRKGDLRCSILETLRHDAGGRARSESELARLSGATRTAVRKALAALVLEGEVSVGRSPGNDRDHPITLHPAA
jgi:hypothetical protein